MPLTNEQIKNLIQFVASVTPDQLNCDQCLEQVPELADSLQGDRPLTDILQDVQNHLDNCPCCAQEYEIFLEALKSMDAVES